MKYIFPHPLLMCIYLCFFICIIKYSPIFKSQFYTKNFYVILFLVKVVIGIGGFFLLTKYTHAYDTKCFINEARTILGFYDIDKSVYFRLVFGLNDYQPEPPDLLPYIDQIGYWYDYSTYFMVRLIAILLPFCCQNTILLFVVFSFFTTYFLYLFFDFIVKNTTLNEVLIPSLLFIVPGFLFWNSQIHKDAVISVLFILITFSTYKVFYENRYIYLPTLLGGFFFMFFLRYYTFFLLIPAWLSWVTIKLFKINKPIIVFIGVYIVFILLAFFIDVNFDSLSLMKEITIRQDMFLNNWGNTSYYIKPINNSLLNMLQLLPYAFINSFIHPFFVGCKNFFCYLNSVETVWIIVLLLILLFKVNYKKLFSNALSSYFLFFSLSITTLSGLIVNNGGAIARYRSLSIILIVIVLFNHIELYKSKDK